MNLN
ncbi:hypothetical protein F383_26030 [Gossypium arboreum]|jgi:ArsR family transcriptional regulator, lead/cadmium/zinc/bismuth-responsive transcriptional repressor